MLYIVIEIRPGLKTRKNKSGWRINYYDLEHQRDNIVTYPSALGFYHHKRSIPVEKAFEDLKTAMIASRQQAIENLLQEVISIQKLSLPKSK